MTAPVLVWSCPLSDCQSLVAKPFPGSGTMPLDYVITRMRLNSLKIVWSCFFFNNCFCCQRCQWFHI